LYNSRRIGSATVCLAAIVTRVARVARFAVVIENR
jgi:hypothetical protein